MLSRPLNGWTDFSLGQEVYGLSYLTNVPIEWVNQAIHGLETLEPFAVHGVMEPDSDIWAYVDAWSAWDWDDKVDIKTVKKQLEEKLNVLKELIVNKECYFGENRGFF